VKILITGNTGYIGPVLAKYLRGSRPGATLVGFDCGYFAHCLTGPAYFPELRMDQQHWGDVRNFPSGLLEGADAVVHLAAISNDPMGNQFEAVTESINSHASIALAKQAKRHGVKSFVFASSCSMYGYAEGGPRKESDGLNPLTAYAKSKVAMEQALGSLADDQFTVTALRFATACGMSERLRLDLVLNDFVACAISSGEITVLSDGTPWRPLIDVKDMARGIDWAISRPARLGGGFLAINTGSNAWNYQVKDLANAVANEIPGTRVSINKDAPPDKRSYQVDFTRYSELAPEHQPVTTLAQTIQELKAGLEALLFSDKNFRSSRLMRLKVLTQSIESGILTQELRWTEKLGTGFAINHARD